MNEEPIFDLIVLNSLLIHYLVPHESQGAENQSPLQGFSPGILQTARGFAAISTLPLSVLELFLSSEKIIQQRIAGSNYISIPLELNSITHYLNEFQPTFCCIWSETDKIAYEVEKQLKLFKQPILHITPSTVKIGIAQNKLTWEQIYKYSKKVLEYWGENNLYPELAGLLKQSFNEFKSLKKGKKLLLKKRNHLVTVPMELVLESARYQFSKGKSSVLIGEDNEPYYTAIRSLGEVILEERRKVFEIAPSLNYWVSIDLILTVPSMLKNWHEFHKKVSRDYPKGEQKLLRTLFRQFTARSTYCISGNSDDIVNMMENPVSKSIISIRRKELGAYTCALAILASSNFVPVIRLPLSLNDISKDLNDLNSAARAKSPQAVRYQKLSKAAKRLSSKLAKIVPEWVYNQIHESKRIKLIMDVPMEWLEVDGIPLLFQVDISKIPTTPGNLFFRQTVSAPQIIIGSDAFKEVLIISAYRENDPIKNKLKKSIELCSNSFSELLIRFENVRNKNDFVRVINDYKGAILVYDGHGEYKTEEDISVLSLPDEDLNMWELQGEVIIPPIVILSACDTHPFGASHVTTANGFLACGAITVLGTSLPVNADYAAVFITRLLLRINQFLPILLERPTQSFRWSEILPGLQRRNYVSEALKVMNGKEGIQLNEEAFTKIMLDIGMAIDLGETTWFNTFIELIASHSSKSIDVIKRVLEREAYLTDALLYTQLGSPENILVTKYTKKDS